MIKMSIEIAETAPGPKNESGVGVRVRTEIEDPTLVPSSEGATFIGLCLAINEYMRSHGAPNFDCMRTTP